MGEDGSRGIRWEHFACSSADEQCDHHRRESPQRLPQRHHASASSIRCAIQARPRNADQHQEHRQPRRPRRRPQQAPDHPAGRVQRALQNPRSRETLVHSQKGQTQRRHVRRFARFVSCFPIALWFAFCAIGMIVDVGVIQDLVRRRRVRNTRIIIRRKGGSPHWYARIRSELVLLIS